ncbi:MaoC family dehydratase [Burkholderia oklahomensis]|uniref:MaoC like domain protein n=1 Tax=Burkholderia oklahomensis TaxID=342113 RepID=A0AAI8B769_9BURK|nr:MaoC family dehydratase [Burkholderia oklahomensis]AIO66943.1 maoC like domain protein [Burkholderia oklahomensis]AJX32154.1 maoC like domain protein [Burkholderia oklahomensis C6786]AOI42996.1 dehydratase [Burkholderia oklahomensis EO147]AOI46553.1 dehydratase [Burkholderia oklahomensis C6786]KUY57984.1 dehydratase [Burkholderia oklahomensis EO147]
MTDTTDDRQAALPTIASAQALRELVGGEPFVSGWITVDQPRVDRFAEATDDRQWIHVDPERARRESPFGGPIAHGFLTLSLIPALMVDAVRFEERMSVNYGLNRVRFLRPVPVGARVRARFAVKDVSEGAQGGMRATWSVSVEIEHPEKQAHACAAEFVTLHFF